MRIYALWLTTILNVAGVLCAEGLLEYLTALMSKNSGRSNANSEPNFTSNTEGWPKVKVPFRECDIQSPTNIDTTNAVANYDMPGIIFHRTASLIHQNVEIMNTGYYLEIVLDEDECKHKPYVVGGPLYDEPYVFEQMHFHWGKSDKCGSEHHVNGKCHSTEVHMVFYKKEYGSFKAATEHTDGVAVISFFGDVNEKDNPHFAELCTKLTEIRQPGTKTMGSFKHEFEFVNVLFQQTEYFSFPGSLTTEPYQPCVTWIMYTNPFPISSRQLDAFRQLLLKNGEGMIRENDRPLQQFSNRPIIYPVFNKDFRVESHESASISDEST